MELMALESFQGDRDQIATVLESIRSSGMVSRSDVAPYIDHFPITHCLESFTEEPSTQNVGVATEAMGMLFKIAVGVALGAAIGAIIFVLTRSKSTTETACSNAHQIVRETILLEELEKAQQIVPAVSVLPPVDTATLPRDLGVTQKGTVRFDEVENGPVDLLRGALTTKVNKFAQEVRTGKFIPFSRQMIPQVRDVLTENTRRVKEIDKLMNEVVRAVEANNIDKLEERIYVLVESKEREVLIKTLERYYSSVLPPHGRAPIIEGSGNVADTSVIVDQITTNCIGVVRELVGEELDGKTIEAICAQAKANGLSAESVAVRATATEVIKNDSVKMGDLLGQLKKDFETLKNHNNNVKLPEQIEKAFNVLFASIQRDIDSVGRMIDCFALEVESLLGLAIALAQFVTNDTKLVAAYVNGDGVPSDVKRKFDTMVKSALDHHERY